MTKSLIAFLFTIVFSACSDTEPIQKKSTYEYFESSLNVEMSYTDLVEVFGEPSGDIGSGIHIYVYPLEDGTKMIIGFVDKPLYARHVDKEENLIKILF